MMNYYYLVSFCPPENVGELNKFSQKMRAKLAREAGLKMDAFTDLVAPELAGRIVAFQQATRKPDKEVIQELSGKLKEADNSPEQAAAYQAVMSKVATHPGRAKTGQPAAPAKRLRLLHPPLPVWLLHADVRTGF